MSDILRKIPDNYADMQFLTGETVGETGISPEVLKDYNDYKRSLGIKKLKSSLDFATIERHRERTKLSRPSREMRSERKAERDLDWADKAYGYWDRILSGAPGPLPMAKGAGQPREGPSALDEKLTRAHASLYGSSSIALEGLGRMQASPLGDMGPGVISQLLQGASQFANSEWFRDMQESMRETALFLEAKEEDVLRELSAEDIGFWDEVAGQTGNIALSVGAGLGGGLGALLGKSISRYAGKVGPKKFLNFLDKYFPRKGSEAMTKAVTNNLSNRQIFGLGAYPAGYTAVYGLHRQMLYEEALEEGFSEAEAESISSGSAWGLAAWELAVFPVIFGRRNMISRGLGGGVLGDVASRGLGGAVTEGFQEGTSEGAYNVLLDRPITENVGHAALLGATIGGGFGAGAGLVHSGLDLREEAREKEIVDDLLSNPEDPTRHAKLIEKEIEDGEKEYLDIRASLESREEEVEEHDVDKALEKIESDSIEAIDDTIKDVETIENIVIDSKQPKVEPELTDRGRLEEYYSAQQEKIDNFHHQEFINFKAMPVSDIRDKKVPNINIYKSPIWKDSVSKRGSQSSEYFLAEIEGRPAYVRISNHWGKFVADGSNKDWKLEGSKRSEKRGEIKLSNYFARSSKPPTDEKLEEVAEMEMRSLESQIRKGRDNSRRGSRRILSAKVKRKDGKPYSVVFQYESDTKQSQAGYVFLDEPDVVSEISDEEQFSDDREAEGVGERQIPTKDEVDELAGEGVTAQEPDYRPELKPDLDRPDTAIIGTLSPEERSLIKQAKPKILDYVEKTRRDGRRSIEMSEPLYEWESEMMPEQIVSITEKAITELENENKIEYDEEKDAYFVKGILDKVKNRDTFSYLKDDIDDVVPVDPKDRRMSHSYIKDFYEDNKYFIEKKLPTLTPLKFREYKSDEIIEDSSGVSSRGIKNVPSTTIKNPKTGDPKPHLRVGILDGRFAYFRDSKNWGKVSLFGEMMDWQLLGGKKNIGYGHDTEQRGYIFFSDIIKQQKEAKNEVDNIPRGDKQTQDIQSGDEGSGVRHVESEADKRTSVRSEEGTGQDSARSDQDDGRLDKSDGGSADVGEHGGRDLDGRAGREVSDSGGEGGVATDDSVHRGHGELGQDDGGLLRETGEDDRGGERGDRGDGDRSFEDVGGDAEGSIRGGDERADENQRDTGGQQNRFLADEADFNDTNDGRRASITDPIENYLRVIEGNEDADPVHLHQELSSTEAGREALHELFNYGGTGGQESYDSETIKAFLSDDEYFEYKRSSATAYYTPHKLVRAIWRMMLARGQPPGKFLEPSGGIGRFIGHLPSELQNSVFTLIDKDPVSTSLAKLLFPDDRIIQKPLQKVEGLDNTMDGVVGNVPFVSASISHKGAKYSLHDYMIIRSLEALKPGAMAFLITSRFTLDKKDPKARQYMYKLADLVNVVRFPDSIYKYAQVTTDLLAFRKRVPGEVAGDDTWLKTHKLSLKGDITTIKEQISETEQETRTDSVETDVDINQVIYDKPENVLGEPKLVRRQYGPAYSVFSEDSIESHIEEAEKIMKKDLSTNAKEQSLKEIKKMAKEYKKTKDEALGDKLKDKLVEHSNKYGECK